MPAYTLTDPCQVLPRLPSRLHALGAVVTCLHVEDGEREADVHTVATGGWLAAVAARCAGLRGAGVEEARDR